MTSQPIVIFGLRIPENQIQAQIAKLERANPGIQIGGYEDWDLQHLANAYQLPLIVVRRAYHDGDTSDRNELINNCPVYIGFSFCEQATFNPHDLLREITQQHLTDLNDLLLDLDAPDGDYNLAFNLDTFDIDAGIETYNPIQPMMTTQSELNAFEDPTDIRESPNWIIDSDLEDLGPDSP